MRITIKNRHLADPINLSILCDLSVAKLTTRQLATSAEVRRLRTGGLSVASAGQRLAGLRRAGLVEKERLPMRETAWRATEAGIKHLIEHDAGFRAGWEAA
jgi:hypothetical protein